MQSTPQQASSTLLFLPMMLPCLLQMWTVTNRKTMPPMVACHAMSVKIATQDSHRQ